jgi:hypothetical protein
VEADAVLVKSRIESLEEQLTAMRDQRDRLAQLRVEYSNLTADVEHRRTLLEEVESNLAEASANQLAAQSCSLISPLGKPDGGSRPTGLSRRMMGVAGVCGGLLVGWGLLFLTAPIPGLVQPQVFNPAFALRDEHHELTVEGAADPYKQPAKNGKPRVADISASRSQHQERN